MNVDEIKFRCSSLGHIMTEPKSKSEVLSETCKTHLVDVFVSAKYNRHSEINAKMLDKGNEVEEDSITTVSRITKTFFKKNEEMLENKFIKGTPDLFKGIEILKADIIRDTKSSWDAYTFFRAKYKKLSDQYRWQVLGYLDLSEATEGYVDYCLNNTPYHLVEGELRKESYNHNENNTPTWIELQIIANHTYDLETFKEYIDRRGCIPVDSNDKAVFKGFVEIPLHERHHAFYVERDNEMIDAIHKRVIQCREWMQENLLK